MAAADQSFEFEAELWIYEGPAAWHFLTLPAEIAEEIRQVGAGGAKAFGSVKVRARIGETEWDTSIFPDTERGSYLLPVKQKIRDKADLLVGDSVTCLITIV